VRGRVLGTECLAEVLGDDTLPAAPVKRWRRKTVRAPLDRVCGALLGLAALATLFPWTRFSTGSRFAGAWAIDRRWSMLAAVAAVVALALWLAFARRPIVTRVAAIAGGVVVTVGSLMAILNPPPFTKPALAPWIALGAGLGAAVTGVLASRKVVGARV
jgi:hypothetical protein